MLLLNQLLKELRKEGFFIHSLDHGGNIYHARKDAMVINVEHEASVIRCRCSGDEMPFVRTAMTEVVARIEQTLRALQRPLDAKTVLDIESSDQKRISRNARMRRFINVETLIPDLKEGTRDKVIAELLDAIAKKGLLDDKDIALEDVMRREDAMSTGLRNGFACPHARTDGVRELVCAIGIHRAGIPFNSLDGEPTRFVLLVLSPKGVAAPYMEFMASMHRVFDEEGRRLLLECETSQQLYDLIIKRLG